MKEKNEIKGISIVGAGYVGLCTAVGFASKGYRTIISTHNREKASSINKGIPPFHEPSLQDSLMGALENGSLKCVLAREEAILETQVTFITVATPSRSDGSIDLQYVKRSAIEIGESLGKKDTYHLVVVKSTVVPGTTGSLVRPLIEMHSGKRCGSGFGLCMSPEFMREGTALYDTLHPDRLVIGENDMKSGDALAEFYIGFHNEQRPLIVRTNLPTAELIKYANNAFLATKISFINTFANICEAIPEADVEIIAKGIGLDQRINSKFLRAGLGYGGSCFPKDVEAIIAFANQLGYTPNLLQAVQKVNDEQAKRVVDKARAMLAGLRGKRIAVLGLSFKPDSDDMREARSVLVINQLLGEGAEIAAYDPVAIANAKRIFKDRIRYATSPLECLRDADCCVIVTEWAEFQKLAPEDFVNYMRRPILIDGRRIYDAKIFGEKLKYFAIGLGSDQ